MGIGGLRLHDWILNSHNEDDARLAREMVETTGAVILGRRTFDIGIEVWNDTPFPVPCFVLTHRPTQVRTERSGTFTFVPDVPSALALARAAAGDKAIRLMGGACSRAFLDAGLVDEIQVQIAPVLLGQGHRLFEPTGASPVGLEQISITSTPNAAHLSFRMKT